MTQQQHVLSALRDRAYALADTGRFGDWEQLCTALTREGADAEAMRALSGDGLFKLMIRNRIKKTIQLRR
jgi:hypothetical protein